MINSIEGLLFLILADFIGRRNIFTISFILIFGGITVTTWYSNLSVKLIAMGIGAGCESICASLLTMVINESTRKYDKNNFLVPNTKIRSSLVAGSFAAYGLGTVFINAINIVVKTSYGMAFVGFVSIFVTWIIPLIFIAESPKWLYIKGKFSRFMNVSVFISKLNKTGMKKNQFLNLFIDPIEKDREFVQEMGKITIEDMKRSKISPTKKLSEIFLNKM